MHPQTNSNDLNDPPRPRRTRLAAVALAILVAGGLAAVPSAASAASGADTLAIDAPQAPQVARAQTLRESVADDKCAAIEARLGQPLRAQCLEALASPVAPRSGPRVSPLIVGGTPVQQGKGPSYMARLVAPGFGDFGFCGGTLVAPTLVLTAGHCVTDCYDFFGPLALPVDPAGINVVLGTQVSGSGGLRHKLADIIVHPDYDCFEIDADVAFLVLAKPTKGPYAKVIAPSEGALVGPDTTFRAFGWGSTESAATPIRLRQVDLDYLAPDACQAGIDGWAAEEYGLDPGVVVVTDNMLCTVGEGKGTCHGDSGGPLFAVDGTSLVQVGVTSWGPGDGIRCRGDIASVFSHLLELRPFLDSVLAADSGAQLVLKQPFLPVVHVTVSLNGEALDDCHLFTQQDGKEIGAIYAHLGVDLLPCSGPHRMAVAGSVLTVLLPASASKYTVSATGGSYSTAFDTFGPTSPITSAGTVTVLATAGKLAAGSLDLKPSVPILQLPKEPVYGELILDDGEGAVCTNEQRFTFLWCSDPSALLPLAAPFVAVVGGQAGPGMTLTGGQFVGCAAFDCAALHEPCAGEDWCDVPVSNPASLNLKPLKPGVLKLAAPKFTVSLDFAVLDFQGSGKTGFWQADLWEAGGPDIVADCMFASFTGFSNTICGYTGGFELFDTCPGDLYFDWDLNALVCEAGAIVGMQSGKVAVPASVLPDALDIESSQFTDGKTTTAFVEGLVAPPGKLTVVKLKYGNPAA